MIHDGSDIKSRAVILFQGTWKTAMNHTTWNVIIQI